jgi:hypothetical protein
MTSSMGSFRPILRNGLETMTEWPSYKVADEAVVHALGVMNINYVRFEATHVYMLAAAANMKQNQAAVFISRMNPTERENVIKIFSKKREWPTEAYEGIAHYLKALHVLTENRNMLIHGNIVDMWALKAPGVITMNREGMTTVIQISLPAIRQVADDLNAYSEFGYMLACYLACEFSKTAMEAGMAAPSNCPPLPLIPKALRPSQPKKSIIQA